MSLEDKVADQISEWTDDNIMFTAYDVTIALRNSGERVDHKDVHSIVHKMYNDQDFHTSYDKTSITVPGTNVNAFLFYHINTDIDDYEPVKPTYPTATSKSPTISTLTQRVGVRNKQPINGILSCAYPKYNGSLTIPSKLLISSGLKGKEVAITIKPNKIIISSSINADPISEIKKPKADDVLILSRKILKSLSKNTYTISLSSCGKEIHVE